jgi:hypothetical protein
MSVEEFHDYLGMPQTKFSERVFGVLDADGSGALDFEEFSAGVWNYCTYDTKVKIGGRKGMDKAIIASNSFMTGLYDWHNNNETKTIVVLTLSLFTTLFFIFPSFSFS